jgi:hypothetical protein
MGGRSRPAGKSNDARFDRIRQRKGFRVVYQKREARFMLRAGTVTTYFSVHDYNTPRGMDWLQLRIDVLTRARQKTTRAKRKRANHPTPNRFLISLAFVCQNTDQYFWICDY